MVLRAAHFGARSSSRVDGFAAGLHDLDVALHDAFGRAALGIFERQLQRLQGILFIGSDGRDADCSALPQLLMIRFGDGDIEFRAQAVSEAADDHSLVLERLGVRDVDVESQQGDRNYRVTSTFSVTKASMMSPTLMSLKFWIPIPHS